jgi:quercetin dioxygenase-like cupin family protein
MRTVLLLMAVCASVLAQKHAGTPADPVPVAEEPDHRLVFENEYVRVFKVVVPPHAATLVHRHERDYVVVTIGEADVTNEPVGKPAVRWQFKDGDVKFLKGGFAHRAVNEGDKPFVNYTVELKKPDAATCGLAGQPECIINCLAGHCFGEAGTDVSDVPRSWSHGRRKMLFGGTSWRVMARNLTPAAGQEICAKYYQPAPSIGCEVIFLDSDEFITPQLEHAYTIKRAQAMWFDGVRELQPRHVAPFRLVTIEFLPSPKK